MRFMTIHTRAEAWDLGELPESLVQLARKHHPRATMWRALPQAGRAGYKDVGLEVHVVEDRQQHTAHDVAGAVMAMVNGHHSHPGNRTRQYRIDAFDETEALLGDTVIRFNDDDEIEDLVNVSPAAGHIRWMQKALDDSHTRHMAALDKLQDMAGMVRDALEVMGNAVADTARVRLDYVDSMAQDHAADRKHETHMKLLDLLAEHIGKGGQRPETTQAVLDLMPADVTQKLENILGTDALGDLREAAGEPDPASRRARLVAVASRITNDQQRQLAEALGEWGPRLARALQREVNAGVTP